MRKIASLMAAILVACAAHSANVSVNDQEIVLISSNKQTNELTILLSTPRPDCLFGNVIIRDASNALSQPAISIAMMALSAGLKVNVNYDTNTPTAYLCNVNWIDLKR